MQHSPLLYRMYFVLTFPAEDVQPGLRGSWVCDRLSIIPQVQPVIVDTLIMIDRNPPTRSLTCVKDKKVMLSSNLARNRIMFCAFLSGCPYSLEEKERSQNGVPSRNISWGVHANAAWIDTGAHVTDIERWSHYSSVCHYQSMTGSSRGYGKDWSSVVAMIETEWVTKQSAADTDRTRSLSGSGSSSDCSSLNALIILGSKLLLSSYL